MTVIANPGTVVEVTFEGATGLVGTLELGIYDGDTVIQALSTTGINEIAGSGKYVGTRTMPGTVGFYQLLWSVDGTLNPDSVAIEDLIVTGEGAIALGSVSSYVTRAQLKSRLEIPNADTQFDDELDTAREAASRCCDGYKHTRFYPTVETRTYTPTGWTDALPIDDLSELTTLTLDFDGDGTYETTWTAGTEFFLQPENYVADGVPANKLVLNEFVRNGNNCGRWPRYRQSVRVAGTFGWAETPANVVEAAALIAVRLFKRRETPYAIMSVIAAEAVAAARLGNIDPDAKNLLDSIPGAQRPALASLQLG